MSPVSVPLRTSHAVGPDEQGVGGVGVGSLPVAPGEPSDVASNSVSAGSGDEPVGFGVGEVDSGGPEAGGEGLGEVAGLDAVVDASLVGDEVVLVGLLSSGLASVVSA